MHKTKEVRWFFQHHIRSVQEWFDKLNDATSETRADHYLESDNDDIGIKISEGKVEIKHRIGNRARGCLNSHIWGHYDDFIRWSFDDVDGEDSLYRQIQEGEFDYWIPVRKERNLVQLTEDGGRTVTKSVAANVAFGCQVEYSRIRLNGETETWHTIGLEWFGNRCWRLDGKIVSEIFGDYKLQMQESLGYAAFLKKFVRNKRHRSIRLQN